MRALILLLATSWCRGYPALHEPVYVLVSQPVSPAQELTPAIPTHVLQEAPSSTFRVSSPEEEASHGQLSSLLAAQDPLLKGGVLVPESPLVAEPVIEVFCVEDPVVSGAIPVLDAFTAIGEETPFVNEAFPMLETLTVIHENPIVNDGRLVAVTLTFLEDGNQALKGASLVDSSIITRHEPPTVQVASPRVNAVPVKNTLRNVSLKKVPAQADTLTLGKDEAPVIEDASETVDYTPSVKTAGSVADPAPVVKVIDPVVDPVPVVKATAHALNPVPVVKAVEPVVDPVPVVKATAHALNPVPVVKAVEPVVDPVPVVKATASVVDPVPVAKATEPVVDPVPVVDPLPVVKPAASLKAVAPVPVVRAVAPVPAVKVVAPVPVVKAVAPVPVVKAVAPVPAVKVVAPVPVVKAVAPVVVASPVVVAAAAQEPLLAPEPPMPSAATPFVGGQFHAQDEAGQYSFGHWGGLNTRVENRDSLGRTSGSFAYVDPEGDVQVRKYVAEDGSGFRVAASDLPLDTAEADLAATEDLVGRPVVSKE